ncbi:hypothetical protein HHI36_002784 [Cryptolaemus montrouzieri]|uniref:C3H1-type domain-containing protein n=1 Tax=Cryptolaemus montrouzieri TaxID=559131 RepID=A0ABD2PCF4_9CUCU
MEVVVCCFNPTPSRQGEKTVECYFHQQGRCEAGNKCRFLHSHRRPSLFWDRTVLRGGQCNDIQSPLKPTLSVPEHSRQSGPPTYVLERNGILPNSRVCI